MVPASDGKACKALAPDDLPRHGTVFSLSHSVGVKLNGTARPRNRKAAWTCAQPDGPERGINLVNIGTARRLAGG